ncbi:hypothetical protein ACH40E_38220 [Streptomyces acidicola]|uniref:hypothetical protein n=1 Tax=Streptomyces acidicola TaxID=2596892 RepID=UPI0037B70467
MATKRSASGKRPTWHDLAAETDAKRRQWLHGHKNFTEYVPCGTAWDAVAVKPLQLGLDALTAMRISTRRGYLVVADHVRGELYVMVPTGHGEAFTGIPFVRVLGRGHQLLVPRSMFDSSVAADWIGAPRDLDNPVVVDPDRLAAHLRELAPGYAEAVAS